MQLFKYQRYKRNVGQLLYSFLILSSLTFAPASFFRVKYLKLRCTDDIIGVEICGAIKNVIAISSGILSGLGANESSTAMLLTEAAYDMQSILKALGGEKSTILSYAGFGDLLMTCTSKKVGITITVF